MTDIWDMLDDKQLAQTILTRLLAKASKDDLCQAVIHAVMVGDRERILKGLKEGIKQVESV